MDYNVEPEIEDIVVTAGDTVNMSWTVYKNSVAFDMSGMQLDIDIVDKNGTVIRSLSSAGGSSTITISTTSYNISTSAFTTVAKYSYDVQLTDGTEVSTIKRGKWIIQKQQTT